MNARKPVGKRLEEFLVSLGPVIAQLGIILGQALRAPFRGLDTPSGRALRQGGDLVTNLMEDEAGEDGRGIAILTITYGYGTVPQPVIKQANHAARQVITTWDVTRDSPRWN